MMRRFLFFFKSYLNPILAGGLIGSSYIPFPPWALLFCYVPLWVWLYESDSLKRSFWGAWWTQFLLSLIGFHWVSYVSHEFGYLPWPIAILILLIFSAFVHLYIPIASLFGTLFSSWILKRFFSHKDKLPPFVFFSILAFFTSLGEIFWPSLFPWYLSYPLMWIQSPIAQTADVFGFQGLSFFLLLINATFATAWVLKGMRTRVGLISGVILVLLGLHFFGLKQKRPWHENKKTTMRILLVQGNIGNLEKWMAERGRGYQKFILDEFISLTQEALERYDSKTVDLIVWPESAMPFSLNPESRTRYPHQLFFDFLERIKTPLLTGGYSEEYDRPPLRPQRRIYNGLFVFDSFGQMVGRPYHKTYLLAYGEYTPGAKIFPILNKISPAGEGFNFGTGPIVIPYLPRSEVKENLKDITLGPQICYEGLYPSFSRELSELGADIIVNLTNDSWFGPRGEPYQHLFMTMARAIEVRKPLIRSTNTGISTLIEADGLQKEISPLFEKWSHVYELSFWPQSPPTFYTLYGGYYLFHILFLLFFGTYLFWDVFKSKLKFWL